MVNENLWLQESYAYPGAYSPPAFDWEELNKLLEESVKLDANICECPVFYKIDIVAPGHKREDFIVSVDNNNLDILAFCKEPVSSGPQHFHMHEFNYNCFHHRIVLPENIDIVFVRAEYKDGILSFYFPKTTVPELNKKQQIVVY